MIKRVLAIPLLGMLLLLSPATAFADYTDSATNQPLAAQLTATNRVVVDPKADPALPNPQAINSQILQTQLPLWVVNVAKSQTVYNSQESTGAAATMPLKDALFATHNPITNKITVNGEQRDPPLILMVIDKNGYHVRAFNVNQSIADAAGPAIVKSAASHRKDLNGTVSAFISSMVNTPETGPVVSNVPPPPAPPRPINWAFAWVIFYSILGGGLLYGLYKLSVWVLDGHAQRKEEHEHINDRINRARKEVERLSNEVLKGTDVSVENNSAILSVGAAEAARDKRKWAEAKSHVGIAEDDISAAYKVIRPNTYTPARSHVTALKDVPKRDRKKTRIRAKSPSGERITISNSDYKTREQSGYRNYYPGGVYDGVPFPAGWYPYVFWSDSWVWNQSDIDTLNEPLPTHTDYDYGYHDYSGRHSGGGSTTFDSDSGSRNSGASAGFAEPSHHHKSSSDDYSGSSSSGASASFSMPSIDIGGMFSGGSDGGGSAGF